MSPTGNGTESTRMALKRGRQPRFRFVTRTRRALAVAFSLDGVRG